jgi:hypothetical protein
MTKNTERERILGTVKELDVVLRPKGQKRVGEPAALKLRTRVGARNVEEWFAVAKPLKSRIRDLAEVPDELIGHTFEFGLSETGAIVRISRIST